ncbi:MAG: PA0069 family radical SAM protein [Pseudomonadota bacterium]
MAHFDPYTARARGRAARSNSPSRYDSYGREAVDDGWAPEEYLPPLRTHVSVERPRSAITRNTSPDISFDRSINPYRGCEHGCIYCFARPSHAWLGLSPGLDFETQLVARPEAPDVLEKELARPAYKPAPIAIGTNTDPYQPIEKDYRVMRRILEVLAAHNHPITVTTKGTLIERDIDILGEMAAQGLAQVGVSVTTLDAGLARRMEPRVPPPARRLRTIEKLTQAGIPVRVQMSPVIPGLTDHELEAVLEAGQEAGAQGATSILLRLPREVAELFREWLAEAEPGRAARVMARVRETHGGKDYDPAWGKRMRGEGVYAEMIRHRFLIAIRRLGLSEDLPPLRTDLFCRPPKSGDQLELF